MNLRMGHFWSAATFSAISPMTLRMASKAVIIEGEFIDDEPIPSPPSSETELIDEDIIEHIYEETGVDFTNVEYQDEGNASMASNKRTESEGDLEPPSVQ